MFSLMVIPILFLYFGIKRFAEIPRYHEMPVTWYNNDDTCGEVPDRIYLDITLTGDPDSDELRINFGELYIREICLGKNTLHGLDFHFSDNCTYAEFVRVLDIANIQDVRYLVPSDEGVKMYFYERKTGTKVKVAR